jgi:hypothetical protein
VDGLVGDQLEGIGAQCRLRSAALDIPIKTYQLALDTSTGSVLAERKALALALSDWKATQDSQGTGLAKAAAASQQEAA